MTPVPILFMSDAVTSGTGLGRITRDLATRLHAHCPEFRVGTYGYGGEYSRALEFPQYQMVMDNWHCYNLPDVWRDFAGTERGILFVIWDASRLLWLSRPENEENPRLQNFLKTEPFEKWTYTPIDAHGINGGLTPILKHTLQGFSRIMAYSSWARDVLQKTLDNSHYNDVCFCPHGIDTSVFYPRNRIQARHSIGDKLGAKDFRGKITRIPDDQFFVGVVGTNQVRKDWGLAAQILSEITKQKGGKVWSWCHTDRLENSWSLPGLMQHEFPMHEKMIVSTAEFTDEQMAWAYSACDLTLGIGNGEGFGYPIFESLACGTPCLHGNYGGAAEHMQKCMLVDSVHDRLEGPYSLIRKCYRVEDWVEKANSLAGVKSGNSLLPEHLAWENLWPSWQEWFLKGLQ